MIKVFDDKPLIELAKQGKSANQIIETLGLSVGVRQVQRITAPYRAEQCAKARLDELDRIGALLDANEAPLIHEADANLWNSIAFHVDQRRKQLIKQATSQ